jgi:hypothetical protein
VSIKTTQLKTTQLRGYEATYSETFHGTTFSIFILSRCTRVSLRWLTDGREILDFVTVMNDNFLPRYHDEVKNYKTLELDKTKMYIQSLPRIHSFWSMNSTLNFEDERGNTSIVSWLTKKCFSPEYMVITRLWQITTSNLYGVIIV